MPRRQTRRARQQLVRALITDIDADVDEQDVKSVLTIHWQAGNTLNFGYAANENR